MNLKAYIDSGILESYVLNLLSPNEMIGVERMLKVYPILSKEIEAIENALKGYALANALTPSADLSKSIIAALSDLQVATKLDRHNLPIITADTDYLDWLALIEGIGTDPKIDGVFTKLLHQDDKVTQMLVVSQSNIPEEVHETEHESFLILKGKCKCIINGEVTYMGPGHYMAIPLHQPHDVVLLSSQVTAILQRVKL